MSNMAGLVEAAVERAKDESGEGSKDKGNGNGKRTGEGESEGPVKKTRFSPTHPSGPTVVETQQIPWKSSSSKGKSKAKRKHIHAYPDAVAEGLVSEEEGREMLAMYVNTPGLADGRYYAGSSNFVPCYDPNVDTWEA
jgi:hypothetical protein